MARWLWRGECSAVLVGRWLWRGIINVQILRHREGGSKFYSFNNVDVDNDDDAVVN